jgi:hypothetical protein
MVGDKLVTTRFTNSITRGLAAVGEPDAAVCLLPGTEVAFDREVKYDHPLGWFRKPVIRQQVARFRQLHMNNSNTHHDAFEFPDGKTVLVTRLTEHQTLTVLQLPVTARDSDAVARPQRPGAETGRRTAAIND